MLSWFKKKIGTAQALPPEPGAGSEGAGLATEAVGQQADGAGFFLRLKDGLSRTRKTFVRQIDALFLGKKQIDAELLGIWKRF
jgi:hypothetical protein